MHASYKTTYQTDPLVFLGRLSPLGQGVIVRAIYRSKAHITCFSNVPLNYATVFMVTRNERKIYYYYYYYYYSDTCKSAFWVQRVSQNVTTFDGCIENLVTTALIYTDFPPRDAARRERKNKMSLSIQVTSATLVSTHGNPKILQPLADHKHHPTLRHSPAPEQRHLQKYSL